MKLPKKSTSHKPKVNFSSIRVNNQKAAEKS